MPKPRLIFTLLYAKDRFHLSRNFNLQAVGDLNWLLENYEFESIAQAIDELVILNVDREPADLPTFLTRVQALAGRCFMPIAVGGGIRTLEQADLLFANGADKVVLGTAYHEAPWTITQIVNAYGAQSVVASIDFRRQPDGSTRTVIDCGRKQTGLDLERTLELVVAVGAGEVYLTSIDRDGTGDGYDLLALQLARDACTLPIIAAGGADTYDRLAEGITTGSASAVSTAHLFNFMGDGLADARAGLIAEGVDLSAWDFQALRLPRRASPADSVPSTTR